MQLHEHKHSLEKDLLRKSEELAQHAYKEGHRIRWNEANILRSESNKKQTPWPLVRKRTIPTELPPLVDEI
jgi:hypothetical protein